MDTKNTENLDDAPEEVKMSDMKKSMQQDIENSSYFIRKYSLKK